MSPDEKLVLAVIVGVVFAVTIGWAFHWYILDWRLWWRTLAAACRNGMVAFNVARRPVNRPLPDGVRADGAGWVRELDTDAWDRLDADQAADQLIAEWLDDSSGRDNGSRTPADAAGGHQHAWHERMWWDDPDLTVWDARQAALRCWEILHIEFPRLRAELGIPA